MPSNLNQSGQAAGMRVWGPVVVLLVVVSVVALLASKASTGQPSSAGHSPPEAASVGETLGSLGDHPGSAAATESAVGEVAADEKPATDAAEVLEDWDYTRARPSRSRP